MKVGKSTRINKLSELVQALMAIDKTIQS